MTKNLKPDLGTIEKHIEFITKGCQSHDDGLLEISYLKNSSIFSSINIKDAANYAAETNMTKSVYFCGSLLLPDTPPFGRANDDNFYASSVVWADIDEPHDPEELKKLYQHMPPMRAVVTARTPHRRIQLWWKLTEPLDCSDTLREALKGVQQALNGDPMVTNPARLMRLAGTINRPSEKKKAEGRVEEFVEYIEIPNSRPVDIDNFLAAYPVRDYTEIGNIEPTPVQTAPVGNALNCEERVIDGRETYASEMIYASIVHSAAKLGRWPEPQEVYDDVWPQYSRKVTPRGKSLDHDGRGAKMISQKIKSKLRLFKNGGMTRYGHGTLEDVIRAGKESITSPHRGRRRS